MPLNRDLFVRAERPEDRAHVTTTRVHAEKAGWKVLDLPALDQHGRTLPPTIRETLGTQKPRRSRKPHVETFGVATPKPEAPVSADTEETE